ncbi:MAG: fatty acid--CoA ligase [Burkholderiales bacterium]
MNVSLPALQQPGIRSLADIPRAHARTRPDHPALIFEDRVTTYRQWDQHTNQVAQGLIAALSAPQAHFGHLAKNSDHFFHLYLGAAKSGRVITPVNWRLAPPEIAFILDDAEVELLFVDREHLPLVQTVRDKLPRLKTLVCLDGPAEGCLDYDSWVAAQPAVDPAQPAGADDTVIQMYTSGTTGLPKGAQITNGNLAANLSKVDSEDVGRWHPEDIAVVPLPLFHAGGSTYAMYALYAGGSIVILREAQAPLILGAIRQHAVTKIGVVPAVLGIMLNHPDCADTDFSHLEQITYGGAPIPVDLLERSIQTMKCGFLQMFGMTESTTVGTVLKNEDHDPARPEKLTSCGRVCNGVELKIVDPDGKELPAGETGEILLRGPFITKGYWNRPEATAAAIRDGWYFTGDAGTLDADGYLYVRDRIKDMIISGGENIYPAEVESALSRHPDVLEVAVIGVPDAKWGEAVKAVVVPRPGRTIDPQEMLAFARSQIAGYKCPKSIDVVETMPRNASGKLLKRVLREPYWKDQTRQVS